MHTSPDYSAAYVILWTDDDALSGHGLAFTNGRGTEVCVAALRALEPLVVGRTLEGITDDMRGFWRSLVSDDQLRWLGPEKGVMHSRGCRGRQRGVGPVGEGARRLPFWQLLTDLPPEDIVAAIDFRYIEDALSPDEALDLLRDASVGKAERELRTSRDGAIRRTRRRLAGSGTTTTRSQRSCGRRSRTASAT